MKRISGIVVSALLTVMLASQVFAGTSAGEKLTAQNEAMKLTLVQAGAQKESVINATVQEELKQAAIAQAAKNQALADAAALQSGQAALAAQIKIASTPAGKTPEQAAIVDAARRAVVQLTIKAADSANNAIIQEQLLYAVSVQTAEKQMQASQAAENAVALQSAITGRAAIDAYNENALNSVKAENAANQAALNKACEIIRQ